MSLTAQSGAGRSYFVADLHLTDERPAATGRFFRFLQEDVAGADALYILGDLFEAWVADDHDEQVAHDTAQRLKALAASGTPVYFMHGNRDFMLAERYAALSGMTLLADPTRIDLYGVPTLLMHGDTLCTDDTAYQTFRRKLRHPLSLAALRRLPLSLRHSLARRARTGSESAKAGRALFRSHCLVAPKRCWSQRGLAALRQLELPTEMDQLQRDLLLERLESLTSMLALVQKVLGRIAAEHPGVQLLMTIPGIGVRTAEAVTA